jgi:hypothetical protein
MGFSQASVASTVEGGYAGMDKKIAAIAARVKKRLGGNPRMVKMVWSALVTSVETTISDLATDLNACYVDVEVPLTWNGVEGMLKQHAP